MSRLTAFNFITLNGCCKGPGEDINWHRHGAEENEYAVSAMQAGNTLLFGRVTYEMMAGYWPTPFAIENAPEVAAGMNSADKIVCSRTLQKADWGNVRIIREHVGEEIWKIKETSPKDITLLGSGSLLTQLAELGLIDEYQVMIDPVAIGMGTPLFQGIAKPLDLVLTASKSFRSGVVLHNYRPA